MQISICEIEKLNGDFGRVGRDLGGGEEEMQETGIARFESGVAGDVVCCWCVAVGGRGEEVTGCRGVGFFDHGVHLSNRHISDELEIKEKKCSDCASAITDRLDGF